MTLPAPVEAQVRAFLDDHWRDGGFTVPNAATYPWRWLWDSCFHAIVWADLGRPDRARDELGHVLAHQRADGFIAHVDYGTAGDSPHADFWGDPRFSSITQPPMYGHAVAELARRGVDLPGPMVEAAGRGLRYFLEHRQHPSGLVAITHPWETGCDDSPRFDHWGCADLDRWRAVKGQLVADLPANGFDCAPVSLSALVAWNLRELATVAPVDLTGVAELEAAVAARWDPDLRTWVDGGAAQATSGRTRTADGLLALLVDPRPEAMAQLTDPQAFGGPYGPPGVHRAEPTFDPDRYWRGPVWPQLAYLLWRAGAPVASTTRRGAEASGWAEFWNPDDGTGRGAIPQSWAALALLMEDRDDVGAPPGPPPR